MRLLLVLLIVTCGWAAPLRADAPAVSITGRTMGSVPYTVRVIVQQTPLSEAELQREVDAVLDRIDGRMSTYRPDSELSRFNSSTSSDWFAVSAETARVVARALEIAELSGGAFDPTVGPLVRLWNFGPGPHSSTVPADDAVREAMKAVGFRHIRVRQEPPALRKEIAQAELDLSAIAKGYAVDAVASRLEELGFANYMVEVGGEVRTAGSKENGRPWRIAIERPDDAGRSIAKVLNLRSAALATSGDYRNFFEADGVRYSHTIDPTTGRPVTHQLASASVLADDCMTADALATTMMVLGPQRGLQFADGNGIAAYLIARDGDSYVDSITRAGSEQFSFISPEELRDLADAATGESSFWITVGLALGVFCLAALGLGAGVLLSRKPLQGSCGGLSGGGSSACSLCSVPAEECEEFRQRMAEQIPSERRDEG